MILAVGTKLQAIITRMALDIQERHAVVQGIPLVQVSDKYFWFEWPQLVLYLLHYVLFQVFDSSSIYNSLFQWILEWFLTIWSFALHVQNAFELTFFWWTWVICYSIDIVFLSWFCICFLNLKNIYLMQYEFGWASCFYEDDSLMIVRVALG